MGKSIKSLGLATLLGFGFSDAFTSQHMLFNRKGSLSETELHAFAPPSLIIGPMIRKMREEEAKKKMPMASFDEATKESAGLRVGSGAWKWPPVWPYDPQFFERKEDIRNARTSDALSSVSSMLTGMPEPTDATPAEPADQSGQFDVLDYWQKEKADETTDLDEEAVERLKRHYEFYLRDGMSILEFGAAENSYLPDGFNSSRHVGVGANANLMKQNPALDETMVVDLNDVEEGKVVNSDELKALASDPFDIVLMANTVDFLTNPREVFRTAWYLLKPGGTMIVPFSSKDAYTSKFEKAQTAMWRDMNNDQHMWICGSLFQFSAGEGWEGLKGFDISPLNAKSDDEGPLKFFSSGKDSNLYVVQATKAAVDESIDQADPEKSFRSRMWMLPVIEDRDKALVAPRLARAYVVSHSPEDRDLLLKSVDTLPKIYENLIKMDQFAFTFSMQAQLAADLASDPDFVANEEQIMALKQGLGLRKPSEEFWAPVGEATSQMVPEDKVNLLAHIVPRFGSGDLAQEEALEAFVSGLKPTFSVIRGKCPSLSEGDVELLGSELLAAEILKPGRSTRYQFASWLDALTEEELEKLLAKRKSYKVNAETELEEFRIEREKERAEIEAKKNEMKEQIDKAREERTMFFNPETGKMEPVKKK